jgi:hypothetical protein
MWAMYPWLHCHRQVAAAGGSISGIDRDALWLIAVGALLIAVSALFGGHLGGLTGRPVGRAGKREDRLVYAVGFAGAVLVAVGSVIAAVKAFPAVWIAVLTVVGSGLMFWFVAAWRLLVDSSRSLADTRLSIDSQMELEAPESVKAEFEADRQARLAEYEWDARRYERQMTWRWCLRHAFSSENRARGDAESALGTRRAGS